MLGHRIRTAWRKAIFVLIACALVFVSSAQQYVVAQSLAATDYAHANHTHATDVVGKADHSHHNGAHGDDGGYLKKQTQDNDQESQDGPCCELSCVTFAVMGTAGFAMTSPHGQLHFAAAVEDRDGLEPLDLMRPPRV